MPEIKDMRSTSIDKIDNIVNSNCQKSCEYRFLSIDRKNRAVYVIDIDRYRFIERPSEIDFHQMPTSRSLMAISTIHEHLSRDRNSHIFQHLQQSEACFVLRTAFLL